MKTLLLKTIYKTIISALPSLTYNSITNNFFAPFQIQPYSTYVNFKLSPDKVDYLKSYIENYTTNLELHPIKLSLLDNPAYFISVNIYNCTSPLFLNRRRNITRCEINTYVKDNRGGYGTLILDYCSNYLSLDPVDLFKHGQDARFWKDDDNGAFLRYYVKNEKINFEMDLDYTRTQKKNFQISNSLIQYTDNIYYKNGIYDKLYYDSSLLNAIMKIPKKYVSGCFPGRLTQGKMVFQYKNLSFDKIHSIFYFQNRIDFICGIWHNLYNKIDCLD
jgi:hypothetical protein